MTVLLNPSPEKEIRSEYMFSAHNDNWLLVKCDDNIETVSLKRAINLFRELLKGPLYYVIVLIVSCTLFWRASPVGVVSVAMMCGGDGKQELSFCY